MRRTVGVPLVYSRDNKADFVAANAITCADALNRIKKTTIAVDQLLGRTCMKHAGCS